MRLGTIAFFFGVLGFHCLPQAPSVHWIWLLPLVIVAGSVWPVLRLPAWGIAGFLWSLCWAGPQTPLSLEAEGVDLQLEGRISAIPEPLRYATRVEMEIVELASDQSVIPLQGRLRLNWSHAPQNLQVGDRWRLTVHLYRPRGLLNPGGFDYERWLYSRRIIATGSVRRQPAPKRIGLAEDFALDRFRQRQVEQMQNLLQGESLAGLVLALGVGERWAVTHRQWETLQRTGTAHLLAISGLHISLAAGLALVLGRWLWRLLPLRWAQCWPILQLSVVPALPTAAGYAALAGWSLPTQRALIMLAVALTALLWRRPVAPSRGLAWALLLVLLHDPRALLSGGFWLSFGAVAAIFYRWNGHRGQGFLWDWWALQGVLLLALLPASLLFFHTITPIAPLANAIAIPWVACTVVPLILLSVPCGWIDADWQGALLHLALIALDWLWRFLEWAAQWPWSRIEWSAPPLWTMPLALMGLLLLLAPRGLPMRCLGCLLLLPLLWPPSPQPPPGGFWLSLLDVGQGLAVVVRTGDRVLVYDTGPSSVSWDAGRAVLVPFLRAQGIERVDTLVLSHADRQHTGGTRTLLQAVAVDRVLTASVYQLPVEGAEECRRGDQWHWNGVSFRFLHPALRQSFVGDNASCVLAISGAFGRVLLTGDIGTSVQQKLLETVPQALHAEVLIAPQQGRQAPLPAFLAQVRPRYVLFSTGDRDRHGKPRPEVLAAWRQGGAQILNTAWLGAINVHLDQTEWTPQSLRRDSRKLWRTP